MTVTNGSNKFVQEATGMAGYTPKGQIWRKQACFAPEVKVNLKKRIQDALLGATEAGPLPYEAIQKSVNDG